MTMLSRLILFKQENKNVIFQTVFELKYLIYSNLNLTEPFIKKNIVVAVLKE